MLGAVLFVFFCRRNTIFILIFFPSLHSFVFHTVGGVQSNFVSADTMVYDVIEEAHNLLKLKMNLPAPIVGTTVSPPGSRGGSVGRSGGSIGRSSIVSVSKPSSTQEIFQMELAGNSSRENSTPSSASSSASSTPATKTKSLGRSFAKKLLPATGKTAGMAKQLVVEHPSPSITFSKLALTSTCNKVCITTTCKSDSTSPFIIYGS